MISADSFDFFHLTKDGLKVWDGSVSVYSEILGSKAHQTLEQYRADCDSAHIEMLDEDLKFIMSSNAMDLKCFTGAKLCSVLMSRNNAVLDTVLIRCGELVAWGYLARLEGDETNDEDEDVAFSFTLEFGVSELLRPHALNSRRFPVTNDPNGKEKKKAEKTVVGFCNSFFKGARSPLELSVTCCTQLRDAWTQSRSNKQKVQFTSLPMWKRFSEMLLALQRVPLSLLTDEVLVAFLVNIHNTLFLHAWIVHRDVFPNPETAPQVASYLIDGAEMTLEQMRQKIASSNILATFLLSNNFRIVLPVISSGAMLEEEVARQAADDLANVELEGTHKMKQIRVFRLCFFCSRWPYFACFEQCGQSCSVNGE